MAQGREGTMTGRWRGLLGRLDLRDALDQTYSRLLSYFSNPVSEFP